MGYKIWAIVMTSRIPPLLNLLTHELQCAYKKNRSAGDIIIFTKTRIRTKETHGSIHFALTDAFCKINRAELWKTQYGKGLPKIHKTSHYSTCGYYLFGKLNGKISE